MEIKKSTVMFVTAALLWGASLHASASDLVTNGGFETGSLSGWTINGNFITTDLNATHAHTGSYSAKLGTSNVLGLMSQTQLLATATGQKYHLSFWLANDTAPTPRLPNEFVVKFGSTLLFAKPNIAQQSYMNYTFDVTATGSSMLEFEARNDGGYFNLDDVSVTPFAVVPELGSILGLSGMLGLSGLVLLRRRRK